jgi:hypothetical protein
MKKIILIIWCFLGVLTVHSQELSSYQQKLYTDILVAKVPFFVSNIEIANTDKDNNIITNYGDNISSHNTKYLTPRITVSSIVRGNYVLNIKLYQNNVLKVGSGQTDYTNSYTAPLDATPNQVLRIPGWGTETTGYWKPGTYRYEIWYGDICIGSKTFSIK